MKKLVAFFVFLIFFVNPISAVPNYGKDGQTDMVYKLEEYPNIFYNNTKSYIDKDEKIQNCNEIQNCSYNNTTSNDVYIPSLWWSHYRFISEKLFDKYVSPFIDELLDKL